MQGHAFVGVAVEDLGCFSYILRFGFIPHYFHCFHELPVALQQALSDLARLDGDSDQAFQAGVLKCRWLFYCHLSLQKHLCCTCMNLKKEPLVNITTHLRGVFFCITLGHQLASRKTLEGYGGMEDEQLHVSFLLLVALQ